MSLWLRDAGLTMQSSIAQHLVGKNVHFTNCGHNVGADPREHNGGLLILHVVSVTQQYLYIADYTSQH